MSEILKLELSSIFDVLEEAEKVTAAVIATFEASSFKEKSSFIKSQTQDDIDKLMALLPHNEKGDVCYIQGNKKLAYQHFLEATRSGDLKEKQKGYLSLGVLYQQDKNYSKSIQCYTISLEGPDKNTGITHFHLGFLYYQREEYEEAVSHFIETILDKNTDQETRLSSIEFLASMYYELGEYDKAIYNINFLLHSSDERLIQMGYFWLSNIYSKLKKYDKAISYLGNTLRGPNEDIIKYTRDELPELHVMQHRNQINNN